MSKEEAEVTINYSEDLNEEENIHNFAGMIDAKNTAENGQSMAPFVSGWEEDDNDIAEKDMTNPIEQFLTAAEEGDLNRLQRMYEGKPEFLMAQDRDKYTALHRAAYNDRKEIVEWLIGKGVNLEMRTGDGWTALHCATCWGNYEIVGILLANGVDVNSRTKIIPLHLAINSQCKDPHKHFMTVKYLLEAPGIEMNAINGAGDTPLSLARRTNKKILELLELHLR